MIIILAYLTIPENKESSYSKLENKLEIEKQKVETLSIKLIETLRSKPYNQIEKIFLDLNFLVFEQKSLTYWTDNSFELQFADFSNLSEGEWNTIKLSNSTVEISKFRIDETRTLVLIIPINYSFSYSNEYLKNYPNKRLLSNIDKLKVDIKDKTILLFYIFILSCYALFFLFVFKANRTVKLIFWGIINLISILSVFLFLKVNFSISGISDIKLHNVFVNLIILLNAYLFSSVLFSSKKQHNAKRNISVFFFFLIFQLINYLYFNNINIKTIKSQISEIKLYGLYEEDPLNKILLKRIDQDIKNLEHQNNNSEINKDFIIEKINSFTSDISLQFENKIDFFDDTKIHDAIKNNLDSIGRKIETSNFYQLALDKYEYHYVGLYKLNFPENIHFTIQIKPRKDIKSLSFPNLLAPSSNKTNYNSIRIFKDSILLYEMGNETKDLKYYSDDENTVRIGTKQKINWLDFILYQFYLIILTIAVLNLAERLIQNDKQAQNSLFNKFQLLFSALIIVSFIGILFFSSRYIKLKTEQNQIEILNKKKFYIQTALQDIFYWNDSIEQINALEIRKQLSRLAYIYQTDIHLYDYNGRMVSSSQPILFEQHILSSHINPGVIFSNENDININEEIGKLKYIAGYLPLVNGDFLQLGFISIPQYLSESDRISELEKFTGSLIHFYIFIIILAFLFMRLATRKLSHPIKLMVHKLKEMGIDGKNELIEYESNDEIGQLVKQYNLAVKKLEESIQLLAQSEREAAWRTMARQIAHEINNPLTPMKLTIQQLQRSKELDPAHFEKYFDQTTRTLIEQINHLSGIASTFSNFARLPITKFTKIDIAARLFNTYQLFENNHEHISINYTGVQNGIYIVGDSDQIGQVFTNLIKNAIQAIPGDQSGEIHIDIQKMQQTVIIHIKDNGKGIEEEVKQKLFAPNFTTKSTGMGLGLAIVKNIIELHKGKINFTSAVGIGSDFEIGFDSVSGLSD